MIKLYCKILAFCFALAIDFRGIAPRAPLYWNACGGTDAQLYSKCFLNWGLRGLEPGRRVQKNEGRVSRRAPHRYKNVLNIMYVACLSREMDRPSMATSIKEVERVTTLKHEICYLIWLQFDDVA